MRHLLPALLLSVLFQPALAPAARADTFCDLLWVTRNMIFHRAGYCFSSPLAQQLFGNSGCTGTDPALSATDRAAVARMRELEGRIGCRMDTSRAPSAGQRGIHARLSRLIDLPEPDELGWGCLGYRGAPFTLHAGTSAAAPVTGRVAPGQFVYSEYWPRDGWAYLSVTNGPGQPVIAEGWSSHRFGGGDGACDQEAG
ncbi:DUF4453 domain-containing protein [Pararhodobacter sp. SW119]|uniref:DUF4453 domain-containing protein n=1 Tax=Pararhodobacter sp. SW119 TaxID=2780075 RepID=UPI001ADFBB14|nr:DUF4453 domain-containing protein [Pararhodobacter sp. SW119]